MGQISSVFLAKAIAHVPYVQIMHISKIIFLYHISLLAVTLRQKNSCYTVMQWRALHNNLCSVYIALNRGHRKSRRCWGFPFSVCCWIPLQPFLAGVIQSKVLIASEGYHQLTERLDSWRGMWRCTTEGAIQLASVQLLWQQSKEEDYEGLTMRVRWEK